MFLTLVKSIGSEIVIFQSIFYFLRLLFPFAGEALNLCDLLRFFLFGKEIKMDALYMQRALELAQKGIGRVHPNPMVGAVLVKDHRIIGEGYHKKCGEAHAEVNAIAAASEDVSGATIYVTLEPCSHQGRTPPCADLLIEKGIARAVVGSLDPNPLVAGRGIRKMQDAGINVSVGVLEPECRKLNEVFFHYITAKHPYVVMKTAMSLDGKIATVSGQSQWITGEAARADVQALRAQYTAIMVGVETILCDDPRLTCRLEGSENPIRIIADSKLRIPLDAAVLQNQADNPTYLATTDQSPSEKRRVLEQLGAKVLICRQRDGKVDLTDLMEQLGCAGIDSLLLEGGSTLNGAALEQGIVQKVIAYIAPLLIGGANAKTPIGGPGISDLSKAPRLTIDRIERYDEDIKIIAYWKEMMTDVYRHC